MTFTQTQPVVAPEIPHSKEAEEALVGSVLISPEVYYEVARFVTPDDFYIHRNRWAWQAFGNLSTKRVAIDIMTVSDELDNMGKLAELGGPAYLTALINQVPTSLNAPAYAEIVAGHAERRRAVNVCNEIAGAAYDESAPFDLSSYLAKFANPRSFDTRRTGADAIGKIYKMLFEEPGNQMTFGVHSTTEKYDMDHRFGGLFYKELTTIAGDQGTGKTGLGIWIARQNAKLGKKTCLVSLEMPNETVWLRMACGDLGININQLRSNRLSEETKREVFQKAEELEELYRENIVVYEDPMTMLAIQAAKVIEQPDLMIVDHADLVAGMREVSGVERIDRLNDLVRFLRQNVAKSEPPCHVLLLWQLGRGAFKEHRKPTKHDLWLAGTQDPDNIYILYRPDLYDEKEQQMQQDIVKVEVIPGKARNDFTTIFDVKYDLVHQSFHGMDYTGDHPF